MGLSLGAFRGITIRATIRVLEHRGLNNYQYYFGGSHVYGLRCGDSCELLHGIQYIQFVLSAGVAVVVATSPEPRLLRGSGAWEAGYKYPN